MAFLPGGGDVPFTEDGAPDEDALAEAGAFELEGFGPDQTCNATSSADQPAGAWLVVRGALSRAASEAAAPGFGRGRASRGGSRKPV